MSTTLSWTRSHPSTGQLELRAIQRTRQDRLRWKICPKSVSGCYFYSRKEWWSSDRSPSGMERHWSGGMCFWQDIYTLAQLWHTAGTTLQRFLANPSPLWQTSTEGSAAVTPPCVCQGHPPTRNMALNRPSEKLNLAEIQIQRIWNYFVMILNANN